MSNPSEWKLVPVEPTGKMIAAAQNAFPCSQVEAYRAMLAAAPELPAIHDPTAAYLVERARSLLEIDATGVMVPHGIGRLGRGVIEALIIYIERTAKIGRAKL